MRRKREKPQGPTRSRWRGPDPYPGLTIANEDEIPFDEVVGNCGLSYVGAEKRANDQVYFETGYVVRDAVQQYTWTVNAQGSISGGSRRYNGGLSDAEFEASGNITAVGPGVAGVPAASASAQAILVDGAVCFSGGPSVSFG